MTRLLVALIALNVIEIVGLVALFRRVLRSTGLIHGELLPNHNTSTRDAVNRLERAIARIEVAAEVAADVSADAQKATEMLTTTISIATEIAVQNRAQLSGLAGSVAKAAEAAGLVADDLAASHARADIVEGAPGAAADAASQSPRTS